MSPEIANRIKSLSAEMGKLIEENFAKTPDDTVHARLAEIRDEIHSLGCEVSWKAVIDPRNPGKLAAEVEIWVPKKDLSPEYQKIYDEWFARVNKIKPEP